jgi:LacI family transcriptional regulator
MRMAEKKRHAQRPASPTSLDVARKAGVSQAAVSYVLNGVRHEHVSGETRERILRASRELGYHPHPSARSLRKGQSDEVCCIINAPPSMLSYEIHLAIQHQIFLHGYIPVFYANPGAPSEQWRETLQRIFARHPMGLIMSQFKSSAEDISLARRMGIENIVLIASEAMAGIPTVIFPSSPPGYLAARHLLARGHRHLGIVHPRDPVQQELFQQRLEGMRVALAQAPDATLEIFPLTLSLHDAYALVDSHLRGAWRPSGIYAFNDEYALRLLRALLDRDMRVPQDIAVVGTDDLPFCEFVRPALTSIRFDSEDAIGQRTVEMLIKLRDGQPLSQDISRPLDPQLVPREST